MPARATYTRAFRASCPAWFARPRCCRMIPEPGSKGVRAIATVSISSARDRAFDARDSCATSITAVSNSSPKQQRPRASSRPAARSAAFLARMRPIAEQVHLGHAEIEHLHRVSAAAVWLQPDVVGLQIAMDDSVPVRFRKGQSNLIQKVGDKRQTRYADWLSGSRKASVRRETPSPDTACRRGRLSRFRNP